MSTAPIAPAQHPIAEQHLAALKELLFALADDDLVMGHRNSEWTGIGPTLEEDIAFASMAQDEVGHAQAFYFLLHQLGEAEPDQTAFTRDAANFRSCQFVEQPIGDYAFSLVRQFLYSQAKEVRMRALAASSFAPLAELARKLQRELKYHSLHGRTWVQQLSRGSEEGKLRLQSALNEAYPMAFSLFEPLGSDAELAAANIAPTAKQMASDWMEAVGKIVREAGLQLPAVADANAFNGGRKGYHSEALPPLLKEMTEVFSLDPSASW